MDHSFWGVASDANRCMNIWATIFLLPSFSMLSFCPGCSAFSIIWVLGFEGTGPWQHRPQVDMDPQDVVWETEYHKEAVRPK